MNRTAIQLMDLESITVWLEDQPWYRIYNYFDAQNCLLARYYRSNGYPYALVGGSFVYPEGIPEGSYVMIPSEINEVANGRGIGLFKMFRTFGGALSRARRALKEVDKAYALQKAGAR